MIKPIIEKVNGLAPYIGDETWIAPNATILGDVHIGIQCSIWYQAVLRGDVGKITIGNHTNIQDGVVVHSTTGKSTVTLGNRVTVGHRAIVHGCTTEDDVLIGMGAIVLDNVYVESGAIIAAGAVVKENTRVPSGTIWAGVPAVQVKELNVEKAKSGMSEMAEGYVKYKDWYR
ncbi:MAG TPA: gamma carbonic anhydrase family protein [Cryomorphaceae bacterium]|nr:gamma carbonic anhydrase family protein [Cryomorphaceae bacterium]